jgi:NAD(P)-dependent dehydrogenase (short-subunit alcohol dehydrogenase family)
MMALMDGKICLVTGSTAGIGFYTALEIARMGAAVLVVGRNQARCAAAVHRIRMESRNSHVDYLEADLSSQAQIRSLAQRYNKRYDHLDVLVNNAGGFFLRKKLSADGIEMTFALNHLAYFLLTNLLMHDLKACSTARVINVSSGSHLLQRLDFNDLQTTRFYNPVSAYGRSKLANILFTYELSRRLMGTHVTANALTPGMVATNMWTLGMRWMVPLINTIGKRMAKTPLEGAQTSVYLATSPEVEGVSGKYYANLRAINSDPYTYDEEIARKLWQESLEYVGMANGKDTFI